MNKIYSILNFDWDETFPTIKEDGSEAKDSRTFCQSSDENEVLKTLVNKFGLNRSTIKEKFDEAIGGDGNEVSRICTVHSSSLCAFLHFCNVANKSITIEGTTYNDVHFEFRNRVIEGGKPSNVDIVLVSKDKKEILFLESKFSEYLHTESSLDIREAYFDEYKEIKGLSNYIDPKKIGKFKLKDNGHYLSGLKQMISHYIGIKHFIEDNEFTSSDGNVKLDVNRDDYKVKLGTILFNGWENYPKSRKNYFDDYQKEYEKLAKILNNNSPENLTILPNVLTYQKIFKGNNYELLSNETKKFYYTKK